MKTKYKIHKTDSGVVTLYSDETTWIGSDFNSEQDALDAIDNLL